MSSRYDELADTVNDISEAIDKINHIQEKLSNLDDEVFSVIEILDKMDINDPDDVAESIKEAISILSDIKKELY